jgi:hypothetical protein
MTRSQQESAVERTGSVKLTTGQRSVVSIPAVIASSLEAPSSTEALATRVLGGPNSLERESARERGP